MTQTYTPTIAGSTSQRLAISSIIPSNCESLRSMFSGTSAPSNPIAGQLWYDTANGLIMQWSGSVWTMLVPANARASYLDVGLQMNAVSATLSQIGFFVAPAACRIEAVRLISDTVSVSSSGNEWQFGLRNITAGVELFSGTVGTFTALGGVGGGAEFAVNTSYRLTTNQNKDMLTNAVLAWTMTKVGTATTLARLNLRVEGFYKGA